MKTQYSTTLLLAFIMTLPLWFTSCKKYPENTLWFKNPNKIPVISGVITEYKVNGIDSIAFLNNYYVPYVLGSSPPYPPYTNVSKDISIDRFSSNLNNKGHSEVKSNFGLGNYNWDSKGKRISIFFTVDYNYYSKNIFIAKESIDWDIIYLDKKGKKSKIKTTYNGNTYEITFEN